VGGWVVPPPFLGVVLFCFLKKRLWTFFRAAEGVSFLRCFALGRFPFSPLCTLSPPFPTAVVFPFFLSCWHLLGALVLFGQIGGFFSCVYVPSVSRTDFAFRSDLSDCCRPFGSWRFCCAFFRGVPPLSIVSFGDEGFFLSFYCSGRQINFPGGFLFLFSSSLP